jgi:hypothetical protein
MKHNMGKNEKVLRLIGGAVLFVIGWLALHGFGIFVSVVTTSTIIGFVLAFIGVVIFITGLVSYCPINALVHHNSCEACKIGETHSHMPV